MSHFQEIVQRHGWKSPADALASLRKLKALGTDKEPPEVHSGRGVPSLVTIYVGSTKWPMWRPDARTLCDAGEATWEPPAAEPAKSKPPTPTSAASPAAPGVNKK